ncbi:MAG: hypothetical protein V3T86_04395 [Planctomycetota bacterium]
MRRSLALFGLALLTASAIFAPEVRRERGLIARESDLYDADPKVRAERGERENLLGAALSGYNAMLEKDPEDKAAWLGRFRTIVRLGATASGQPTLSIMVRDTVQEFIGKRHELDPDGTFLQKTMLDWTRLRLKETNWYMAVSSALYLAGRGYDEGADQLMGYTKAGPFFGEFFGFCIRLHPPFRGVRPILEHYLERDETPEVVWAGAALLEYHRIYGEGEEMLARYVEKIRGAFHETLDNIDHSVDEGEVLLRTGTAILGLARLAGPNEIDRLERTHFKDLPRHNRELRIARIWVGLLPVTARLPGTSKFEHMPNDERELFFRMAANRYAILPDGEEKDIYLSLLETARDWPASDRVRVHAIHSMAALCPDKIDLERMASAGGTDSIVAALLLPGDQTPNLLPGIVAPDPHYAAMAAVGVLDERP